MLIELEMALRLRLAAARGIAIPTPFYSLTVKPRSKELPGNLSTLPPSCKEYISLFWEGGIKVREGRIRGKKPPPEILFPLPLSEIVGKGIGLLKIKVVRFDKKAQAKILNYAKERKLR